MKDLRALSRGQLEQMASDAEAKGYNHAASMYRQHAAKAPEYPSIQLQSVGFVPAKLGEDVKIGDVLVWNFGYGTPVKAVLSESKAYRTFQIEENGKLYERRIKRNRLVGCTKTSL